MNIGNIFKFFITVMILISISIPVYATTIPAHTKDSSVPILLSVDDRDARLQTDTTQNIDWRVAYAIGIATIIVALSISFIYFIYYLRRPQ